MKANSEFAFAGSGETSGTGEKRGEWEPAMLSCRAKSAPPRRPPPRQNLLDRAIEPVDDVCVASSGELIFGTAARGGPHLGAANRVLEQATPRLR